MRRLTATITLGLVLTLTACGGGGGGNSDRACVDAWDRKVAAHDALVHEWDALPDTEGMTFDQWVATKGGDPTAGEPPACVRNAFNQ